MCHSIEQTLDGFLCLSLYSTELFSPSMFGQHYLGEGILLQPPIDFGHKYFYRTRCSPWFADIFRFKKNFSQCLFRHQATVWWNSLPPNLFDDIANFHDGLLKYLHGLS